MKIAIVIPTYNERENIEKLIIGIDNTLKNYEVIVVDDNSPDKTSNLVEKLAKKYKIHLIKRAKKLGIGTAYIAGFNYAINKSDLIFTMDADLSHNPKYLPDFIKKTRDYDVVIGSRYIKDGGIINWGILRKFVSKTANFIAKSMLKIPAKDVTSGYRCYKSKVLKNIDLKNITSNGYSFLEELLFKCKEKKYKISETPIIFYDRKYGKSKLSKKEIIKFFITIIRLRLRLKN